MHLFSIIDFAEFVLIGVPISFLRQLNIFVGFYSCVFLVVERIIILAILAPLPSLNIHDALFLLIKSY